MTNSEQDILELKKMKEFVISQVNSNKGEIFGLYAIADKSYSDGNLNEYKINQLTKFLYYDERYFKKPREKLFLENGELNQSQLNNYLYQILEKEAYLQYKGFENTKKQLENEGVNFSKAELSNFHWNQAIEKIVELVLGHSPSEIK